MEHLAIMKKSWGLTEKILSGEKKIESRWYKTKRPPWDRIKAGEKIYFKDSGEPISATSRVKKVLSFSNLTPTKVKKILAKYGQADGIERGKLDYFYQLFKDKKYCLLIFLERPREIVPFEIDKSGFGAMASWLTVENISWIKINRHR